MVTWDGSMSSVLRCAVIEDSDALREDLCFFLKNRGHRVVLENNGYETLAALEGVSMDVALLDLGLPEVDGLVIAKALRESRPDVAIVMVTARSGPGDRVLGWREGADAYLVKPVDFAELDAVLQSVGRRLGLRGKSAWRLDEASQELFPPEGRPVRLSPGETALVAAFCEAGATPVSQQRLLDALGKAEDDLSPNRLPAALSRLRKKVDGLSERRLVVAVRGAGYRFGAPLHKADS